MKRLRYRRQKERDSDRRDFAACLLPSGLGSTLWRFYRDEAISGARGATRGLGSMRCWRVCPGGVRSDGRVAVERPRIVTANKPKTKPYTGPAARDEDVDEAALEQARASSRRRCARQTTDGLCVALGWLRRP